MNPTSPIKKAFFTAHVLPALWVFLIPGLAVWFFGCAEARYDEEFRVQVENQIRLKSQRPAAEKEEMLAFFDQVKVSRIMASSGEKWAGLRQNFSDAKVAFGTFRWGRRIGWICLGTIGATLVLVGLSVAFSLRSQAAQYYALRIGWPVLRASAVIQVVGQAALAVALSYWVTAVFSERYYVKLVGIIGCLAVLAVVALLKAIFAKVKNECELTGELVAEADAPGLWHRVRELASTLHTAGPDRIIVGIEPSFFVTEHPVVFQGAVHEGRTLYLSLPMLKIMAVDEAEAVLGHELAHFSGQDTLWSRKISPLMGKFELYLAMLAEGLSLIVAHFMHLFWKLYGLSIRRLSRVREFRADAVGAELVSKEAMKRALVKITCYCEYRAQTVNSILEKERVDQELNLAEQLEQGYPEFLSTFANRTEAINETVPHPFDTHPTLHNRLEQLGFDAGEALRDQRLAPAPANSWYQSISTAPAIEEQMWASQQADLQSFHSEHLTWGLRPIGEEEIALIRERFPNLLFQNKKGEEATLTYDSIQLRSWSAPIRFPEIRLVVLEEDWAKKRLAITHRPEGADKSILAKFHPRDFVNESEDLLTAFERYYGRHQHAETLHDEAPRSSITARLGENRN